MKVVVNVTEHTFLDDNNQTKKKTKMIVGKLETVSNNMRSMSIESIDSITFHNVKKEDFEQFAQFFQEIYPTLKSTNEIKS